jgi:hypothetical protein
LLEVLRHEDFAPHVDKLFRFEGWHGSLRLDRIERPRQAQGAEPTRAPFTLIFVGPPGDVMPEGLRTAIVDDGPRFEFYIMPIHTPAANRQDYQAVFN